MEFDTDNQVLFILFYRNFVWNQFLYFQTTKQRQKGWNKQLINWLRFLPKTGKMSAPGESEGIHLWKKSHILWKIYECKNQTFISIIKMSSHVLSSVCLFVGWSSKNYKKITKLFKTLKNFTKHYKTLQNITKHWNKEFLSRVLP